MGAFAEKRGVPRKTDKHCRCGAPKTAEVVLQARPVSRKGSLATRARRMCEPCALRVFEAMEKALDDG